MTRFSSGENAHPNTLLVWPFRVQRREPGSGCAEPGGPLVAVHIFVCLSLEAVINILPDFENAQPNIRPSCESFNNRSSTTSGIFQIFTVRSNEEETILSPSGEK